MYSIGHTGDMTLTGQQKQWIYSIQTRFPGLKFIKFRIPF